MPLPKKGKKESKDEFISRCMSDSKTKSEFPDSDQRMAVCNNQSKSILEKMDESIAAESQAKKPGLWNNIRKKKEKEGNNNKPRKPGDPDRPDPDSWKKAQKPKKKSESSEYQGKKVTLNKPFRTPDGPKKFSVYVKNDKDNVVKVNFGDPNMEIKRDDPKRRKSFRARHKCDNPGPKWKARYWSCWQWRASSPVKGDE